jgi:hypothetical protein
LKALNYVPHIAQTIKRVAVCIFIQNSLEYSMIDVNKYRKEQDIEICMLNLKTTSFSSHIMVGYRAPTGNFIGHLLATL